MILGRDHLPSLPYLTLTFLLFAVGLSFYLLLKRDLPVRGQWLAASTVATNLAAPFLL
jgi:hypothetical protein